MKFVSKIAIVVISVAAVTVAGAVPVTWQLDNVTFSDGSSATGSFVFDADQGNSGKYLDVNIEVAGPNPAFYGLQDLATVSAFVGSPPSAFQLPLINAYLPDDNADKSILNLAFYNFNGGTFSALTDAGGRRELVNFNPVNLSVLGTCLSSDCGNGTFYASTRTGFVQSVPEASSVNMFCLGILFILAVVTGGRHRALKNCWHADVRAQV